MASTTSRTVAMYGIARGLRGGATLYDKSPSQYNARMKYLSASIFGDYTKPIEGKMNRKLMFSMIHRPLYERPEIIRYYPPHEETEELMTKLRDYGLFRDEHKDYVEEMERLRNLRGKSRFRDRKKK